MAAEAQVAIAGSAIIGLGRFEEESVASIANRAVKGAIEDCGLERSEIDGLFLHIGNPRGLDYDEVAKLLALDIKMAMQPWAHGRFGASTLGMAWMAIRTRIVEHALVLAAWKPSNVRGGTRESPIWAEGLREGGGPHAETPHTGALAPVFGAAIATRAYFERFGHDLDKLAAVPLAQRKAAQHNPLALMRHKPMTAADYQASRWVVEPLRLFDCSVPSGIGAAFILTSGERARDLRQQPVYIRGFQGIHAGPDEYIFGQRGLGVDQARRYDYVPLGPDEPVFRQAGVTPQDIDTLHCYDGFSPQILWTLERFGFCGVGEAADFVQGGRIEIGGALPVNTSGGHLSEGHSNGWGATAEIVAQLRSLAGERQVAGARVAQWATTLGDSIIYGTDPN